MTKAVPGQEAVQIGALYPGMFRGNHFNGMTGIHNF
jgi:hypothetical protein